MTICSGRRCGAQCSYRGEMKRADERSSIKDMSQADRAALLADSFVVPTPTGFNASSSEEATAKPENLKWEMLGLPPMCDQGLFVLTATTMDLDRQMELSTVNYTFNEANYSREHAAGGIMLTEACVARRPSTGDAGSLPPENCTRWPGCNYSAWPRFENASLNVPLCTESLIISSRVKNTTAAAGNASALAYVWVSETIQSPPRSVLERCTSESQARGNMTCTLKVEIKYAITRCGNPGLEWGGMGGHSRCFSVNVDALLGAIECPAGLALR
jgi:hypothetical protein